MWHDLLMHAQQLGGSLYSTAIFPWLMDCMLRQGGGTSGTED